MSARSFIAWALLGIVLLLAVLFIASLMPPSPLNIGCHHTPKAISTKDGITTYCQRESGHVIYYTERAQ